VLLRAEAQSTPGRGGTFELLELGCNIGVRSLQTSAGVGSGSSSWPF
jgi:hypothetical protein